jgi:hypothetical protein
LNEDIERTKVETKIISWIEEQEQQTIPEHFIEEKSIQD